MGPVRPRLRRQQSGSTFFLQKGSAAQISMSKGGRVFVLSLCFGQHLWIPVKEVGVLEQCQYKEAGQPVWVFAEAKPVYCVKGQSLLCPFTFAGRK